jgi:hypothetical protein
LIRVGKRYQLRVVFEGISKYVVLEKESLSVEAA